MTALAQRTHQKSKAEPTIALINIVFLMLIFFMIAGTLAPPLDPAINLVNTSDLEGRSPPDATVIRPDGTLYYRDHEVSADDAVRLTAMDSTTSPAIRLVPDRELPAKTLMQIASALRDAGAGEVWLVTEQGLE